MRHINWMLNKKSMRPLQVPVLTEMLSPKSSGRSVSFYAKPILPLVFAVCVCVYNSCAIASVWVVDVMHRLYACCWLLLLLFLLPLRQLRLVLASCTPLRKHGLLQANGVGVEPLLSGFFGTAVFCGPEWRIGYL